MTKDELFDSLVVEDPRTRLNASAELKPQYEIEFVEQDVNYTIIEYENGKVISHIKETRRERVAKISGTLWKMEV